MTNPARLLGFAFAGADFLFEIDRNGSIVFATGAASDFVRKDADKLEGKAAGSLFQPSEAAKFATFTRELGEGERAGPFKLKLAHGADAMVSMFHLPQNGTNISCTLARPGSRGSFAAKATDPKTGLPAKENFLSAAAQMARDSDSLTLVSVPNLPDICAGLPDDRADALMQNIGDALSKDVKTAGRLSETSFGAIADTDKTLNFAARIRAVLKDSGLKAEPIEETLLSLRGADLSSEQKMLAVRYVVERFASGQHIQNCGTDVGSTFNAMMDDTQSRLKSLMDNMADGAFTLAYQPIINLKTEEVSHYEALIRFAHAQGTQETVKFAEDLGMAGALDFAVAMKILAAIEREPRTDVKFAFNISGGTISTPSSFGILAGILARKRKFAPRLLIEITETAAISDMEAANKAVAALRAMGYRVGLDDFGAGAASLNCLQSIPVDFVKFDGSLVKRLGGSARDDTMVKGLLKLCDELKVQTITECIEDDAARLAALEIGFGFGQGYLFGKPDANLLPPVAKRAKRQGIRESWG